MARSDEQDPRARVDIVFDDGTDLQADYVLLCMGSMAGRYLQRFAGLTSQISFISVYIPRMYPSLKSGTLQRLRIASFVSERAYAVPAAPSRPGATGSFRRANKEPSWRRVRGRWSTRSACASWAGDPPQWRSHPRRGCGPSHAAHTWALPLLGSYLRTVVPSRCAGGGEVRVSEGGDTGVCGRRPSVPFGARGQPPHELTALA